MFKFNIYISLLAILASIVGSLPTAEEGALSTRANDPIYIEMHPSTSDLENLHVSIDDKNIVKAALTLIGQPMIVTNVAVELIAQIKVPPFRILKLHYRNVDFYATFTDGKASGLLTHRKVPGHSALWTCSEKQQVCPSFNF